MCVRGGASGATHLEARLAARAFWVDLGDNIGLINPNAHRERERGRELHPPAVRERVRARLGGTVRSAAMF